MGTGTFTQNSTFAFIHIERALLKGTWQETKLLLGSPASDFKTVKKNELYESIFEGTLESNVKVLEISAHN